MTKPTEDDFINRLSITIKQIETERRDALHASNLMFNIGLGDSEAAAQARECHKQLAMLLSILDFQLASGKAALEKSGEK